MNTYPRTYRSNGAKEESALFRAQDPLERPVPSPSPEQPDSPERPDPSPSPEPRLSAGVRGTQ